MSNDRELELWRTQRAGQEKHTYFLLAAAGTCIGYALTQTKELYIEWMHISLALALVSWASSFLLGCRHLGVAHSVNGANLDLLRLQSGRDPDVGKSAFHIANGKKLLEGVIERLNGSAGRAFRWQYRFLILGVIFYVAWQVFLMHSRTIH